MGLASAADAWDAGQAPWPTGWGLSWLLRGLACRVGG